MGGNCNKMSEDNITEINIGRGKYRFKKTIVAQNERQRIFYGKSFLYDKNVKDKIYRSPSTVGMGNVGNVGDSIQYNNANVKVIIPCASVDNIFFS